MKNSQISFLKYYSQTDKAFPHWEGRKLFRFKQNFDFFPYRFIRTYCIEFSEQV